MELRPPTEPIHDPFFAAVRRRHPDADIVLLPPVAPGVAVPAAEEVPPDEVSAALALVATEVGVLWAAVAPGAEERAEARLRYGAGPASVRAVATLAVRREDGFELLAGLRAELERRGWSLRRPPGAGSERLTGVRDLLELSASYAEESGALLLTIGSASLPVGVKRAAALTRRGGER